MRRDPVCNMDVAEDEAITASCDGQTYYFCSEGCRDRFLNERACKPRLSYDVIIIGGGPAALTAAVYAATLKMEAFLIAGNLGGQAIDSTKIHNYMGFDFITGPELVAKFEHQLVHSHYIDHLISEVERIEAVDGGFAVTTSELVTYTAKALIVATGMTRRRLGVEGEEEFQRRGLFYGNLQDLSFVQGEDVAVIGGGNSAVQIVGSLQSIAGRIYLIANQPLTADPVEIDRVRNIHGLEIYEGYKVISFSGEDTLEDLKIRKQASQETVRLPVKGAFVAIGLRPNSELVSDLVDLNERGEIKVQPNCSTRCPGLFAAGDVTDAYGKRIIIASGEGAKAAMAARQYLLDLRKKGRPS